MKPETWEQVLVNPALEYLLSIASLMNRKLNNNFSRKKIASCVAKYVEIMDLRSGACVTLYVKINLKVQETRSLN